MVSKEWQFFRSRVMQRELSGDYSGYPLRTKFEGGLAHIPMVPIRVRLFKQIRSGSRFWIGDDTEPILVDELVVNCNLRLIRSLMARFDFTMSNKISEMGVPRKERPAIIRKLNEVVQVAVPYVPISVIIVDVTVKFSLIIVPRITMIKGDLLDAEIVDWESLETGEQAPKFIHASKSSIEGLGQVKLYSLEAAVRKTECAICKEVLYQFELEEEEEEEEEGIDHQLMITCLPCSHLFHRDCIVKWLTIGHVCPICQYPMPTEQVSETPLISERKRRWPMLLKMSTFHVITVTLWRYFVGPKTHYIPSFYEVISNWENLLDY